MREIKFRVWNKCDKRMSKVSSLSFNQEGKLESVTTVNGDLLECGYILMQYTGLQDKNGKEIYEGDIIKTKTGIIGEVRYGNMLCVLFVDFLKSYPMVDAVLKHHGEFEVIGNIYENPELLKEAK